VNTSSSGRIDYGFLGVETMGTETPSRRARARIQADSYGRKPKSLCQLRRKDGRGDAGKNRKRRCNRLTVGAGTVSRKRSAQPRFCVFPRNLAPDFSQYITGNRRTPNNESLRDRRLKMKTFIVYDLDSQTPVAVGEQVSAEAARYCASEATEICPANLLAEEIDLEKQVIH
jgi:hypothetical protein